jgi:hypothetical protein
MRRFFDYKQSADEAIEVTESAHKGGELPGEGKQGEAVTVTDK